MKEIIVFCQWTDGKITAVSRQLLGKGQELAEKSGASLSAALIGYYVDERDCGAAAYGAEKVYVVDHPTLKDYTSVYYATAFEQIIRYANPEIVLIGATAMGRDLAARTAVKMGTGLTADCTMLDIQPESGLLLQTRPAYGGRVTATIICPQKRPQMATVREGVFPTPNVVTKGKKKEIINLTHLFQFRDFGIYVKNSNRLLQVNTGASLNKTKIVVAGGRGVKNEKGMKLVQRLAEVLGGEFAASRGAVEDGLAESGRQIGQTGWTIRPKLYIACGISGASQHLAGVQGTEKILAVNNDQDAPIMHMADYAVCADVFEAVPELIRIAEEMKNTNKGEDA